MSWRTKSDLTPIQTLSTLPDDFEGFNKSADIHVHPSGKYLYVSNRGDFNSIAIFSISAISGRLSLVDFQAEFIHWPRNFAIHPLGRFLLVANRDTDRVVSFEIDTETGRLSPMGYEAEVPVPMCFKFYVPGS